MSEHERRRDEMDDRSSNRGWWLGRGAVALAVLGAAFAMAASQDLAPPDGTSGSMPSLRLAPRPGDEPQVALGPAASNQAVTQAVSPSPLAREQEPAMPEALPIGTAEVTALDPAPSMLPPLHAWGGAWQTDNRQPPAGRPATPSSAPAPVAAPVTVALAPEAATPVVTSVATPEARTRGSSAFKLPSVFDAEATPTPAPTPAPTVAPTPAGGGGASAPASAEGDDKGRADKNKDKQDKEGKDEKKAAAEAACDLRREQDPPRGKDNDRKDGAKPPAAPPKSRR